MTATKKTDAALERYFRGRRPAGLTKPQFEELCRLAKEPQSTYGSSRTRVQNNLVAKGLADYIDSNGKPVTASLVIPRSHLADRCVITLKGRAVLAGGNVAVARAAETAAESKKRTAARKPPAPEPTYPRLELRISHMVIEDRCPQCGELVAIDFGSMGTDEIPDEVELSCESAFDAEGCGAEWSFKLSLDSLMQKQRMSEQLEMPHGWISASDRVPCDDTVVVVHNRWKRDAPLVPKLGWFWGNEWRIVGEDGAQQVTHWYPLPPLPEDVS